MKSIVLVNLYLATAFILGCIVPTRFLLLHFVDGVRWIISQPLQLRGLLLEITVGVAISSCAGLIAWMVVSTTSSSWLRPDKFGMFFRLLLLPGLAGSMLLSLAAVRVFQFPLIRPAYDSPIPWIATLTVWLLPRAAIARLWVECMSNREGTHVAEMLCNDATQPSRSGPRNQLLSRLRDNPRLIAISILCYWAYLDLSTAYLLAPIDMPSGLVRLYNNMHFGRFSALSIEAILFFSVPIFFLMAGFVAFRLVRSFTSN
jgi:hypothetical protein